MKNEEYLSIFGPVQQYSPGTGMVMADRQIKRAIEKGSAHLEEIGNLKAVVTFRPTGKWFMLRGGWGNNDVRTVMLGPPAAMSQAPYMNGTISNISRTQTG